MVPKLQSVKRFSRCRNKALRKLLSSGGNTWKIAQRSF